MRSDKIPDEDLALAVSVWEDNTRESESAKDSVRNLRNRRTDPTLYRKRYQEVPTDDIHHTIVKRLEEKYEGGYFKWSMTMTKMVKPFTVRPAQNAQCFCTPCLEFKLWVSALQNLFHRKSQCPRCKDNLCTVPRSAFEFRREYICEKVDSLYQKKCVENKCTICKDWKLVPWC